MPIFCNKNQKVKHPASNIPHLKRDEELGISQATNCHHVEMLSEIGKKRKTLAGNTKDVFRLIQSIPSKNAEPFNIYCKTEMFIYQ